MAIDQEMLNEIETEKQRAAEAAAEAKAKAAAGGNGAGFFIMKDGEKALIRPLLNGFKSVFRHDLWNQATQKMEVSAICAQSIDLSKEFCAHCKKAEETNNRKLMAVKQFVVPVWLYGIRVVATGAVKTYKNKDGEELPVRGLRYAQFKTGDKIFETLLTMYKMAGDITLRDIAIRQIGSKLKKDYDIDPLDPTPFTVEGVPTLTFEGIIDWIAEKNPASLIENPDYDAFGVNPPAQANKPAKVTVPDF